MLHAPSTGPRILPIISSPHNHLFNETAPPSRTWLSTRNQFSLFPFDADRNTEAEGECNEYWSMIAPFPTFASALLVESGSLLISWPLDFAVERYLRYLFITFKLLIEIHHYDFNLIRFDLTNKPKRHHDDNSNERKRKRIRFRMLTWLQSDRYIRRTFPIVLLHWIDWW